MLALYPLVNFFRLGFTVFNTVSLLVSLIPYTCLTPDRSLLLPTPNSMVLEIFPAAQYLLVSFNFTIPHPLNVYSTLFLPTGGGGAACVTVQNLTWRTYFFTQRCHIRCSNRSRYSCIKRIPQNHGIDRKHRMVVGY